MIDKEVIKGAAVYGLVAGVAVVAGTELAYAIGDAMEKIKNKIHRAIENKKLAKKNENQKEAL